MKETVLAAALALSLGSPSAFAAETADVVVVGAGAAGLSASIGAAARGAKVILLEKTTDAGGNTAFAKLGSMLPRLLIRQPPGSRGTPRRFSPRTRSGTGTRLTTRPSSAR